jgi:hypothetical protein
MALQNISIGLAIDMIIRIKYYKVDGDILRYQKSSKNPLMVSNPNLIIN